jgi:hypothetical protein
MVSAEVKKRQIVAGPGARKAAGRLFSQAVPRVNVASDIRESVHHASRLNAV